MHHQYYYTLSINGKKHAFYFKSIKSMCKSLCEKTRQINHSLSYGNEGPLYEFSFQKGLIFGFFIKEIISTFPFREKIKTHWKQAYMVTAGQGSALLDVKRLLQWGSQWIEDEKQEKRKARLKVGRWGRRYVFRWGPVEGIRKWRGGRRSFRRMKTHHNRKALLKIDANEPDVRGRQKKQISSWDDVLIHRQKCWKKQHKGKKSWDKKQHSETCIMDFFDEAEESECLKYCAF